MIRHQYQRKQWSFTGIQKWCAGCLFMAANVIFAGLSAENSVQSIVPPGMIFELLALNHDIPTKRWPKYRSPAALVPSPDGRYLYIAEQTAKRIAIVDLGSKMVVKTILLPNEVTGIAVAPGGNLYATCSSEWWPNGFVCEIDMTTGNVLRRLPGGCGARSPVVSPDGKTLYICNQFSNDVYFIDIARGTLACTLYAFREPFSCSLTPDGAVLVVVNCLPMQKATDDTNVASKILLVNTADRTIDTTVSLPVGSHSVFDVTVSPDGLYAYVTHLTGMFTLPTTEIEGWIHTNNLGIVDIRNRCLLNDFPLDDAHGGAANPWEIACTSDNTILCVAHAGSNDLTVIDLKKMITVAQERSETFVVERNLKFFGCSHDFSALSACKHRVRVIGASPRALTIVGKRAYTAGYFGNSSGNDEIEIFDLAPDNNATQPAGTIPLGSSPPMTSIRKGEYAFSNGTLCHQSWQSCYSCHPATRADGLNWTLGNDITSAPRNAKSMLYSWWTPRTGWSGKRANAAESIRLGFKNSLFVPINLELAACIDTFLMYLKPVPSPFLQKGRLSSDAQKGWNVFWEDPSCDCRTCHTGPLYTDMHFYSSRIPNRWDIYPNRDTPSLIETWRSAPYDHIGSYDTLADLLRYDGHSLSLLNGLTMEALSDLVQFVLSL